MKIGLWEMRWEHIKQGSNQTLQTCASSYNLRLATAEKAEDCGGREVTVEGKPRQRWRNTEERSPRGTEAVGCDSVGGCGA